MRKNSVYIPGKKIKEAREALGLTTGDIAKKMHLFSGTSVANWEQERNAIRPQHAAALCQILGLAQESNGQKPELRSVKTKDPIREAVLDQILDRLNDMTTEDLIGLYYKNLRQS